MRRERCHLPYGAGHVANRRGQRRIESNLPRRCTMATTQTTAGNGRTATDLEEWRDHTRVFLQPIAAPSVLGLYGFAASTFMVAAWLAGWYGGKATPEFLFPF